MPRGCRRQQTLGKHILDKFYRRISDLFQYVFELKAETRFLKRKSITKQGYRNRIKPRVWGIKDTCLSKVFPAPGPPLKQQGFIKDLLVYCRIF